MSFVCIDIQSGDGQPEGMSGTRDALPLRFKNARTKAALRELSEQSGLSMTDIAEKAIEHELALLGADLEQRLSEALEAVRAYRPAVDLESYLQAAGEGERSGMEPLHSVRAEHDRSVYPQVHTPGEEPDRFGVLAAFDRG